MQRIKRIYRKKNYPKRKRNYNKNGRHKFYRSVTGVTARGAIYPVNIELLRNWTGSHFSAATVIAYFLQSSSVCWLSCVAICNFSPVNFNLRFPLTTDFACNFAVPAFLWSAFQPKSRDSRGVSKCASTSEADRTVLSLKSWLTGSMCCVSDS